jgi:hypothetical protein
MTFYENLNTGTEDNLLPLETILGYNRPLPKNKEFIDPTSAGDSIILQFAIQESNKETELGKNKKVKGKTTPVVTPTSSKEETPAGPIVIVTPASIPQNTAPPP